MDQFIRLAVAALLVALALQAQAAMGQFLEKKVLTLTAAQKIVDAAKAEAERYHLAGVIAVRATRP